MKITEEGKIGNKEFVSILLIIIGIKLSDTTPALLMNNTKTATWMVPLAGFAIILPFFLMAYSVVKHYGKNLVDVCIEIFGSVAGRLLGLMLFLLGYATLVIELRSYIDTISVMFYTATPIFALLLFLVFACFFNAMRGLEAIGTAFYMAVPYIKVSLIILAILMFQQSEISRMFPLLGGGAKEVLKESLKKASIFGDLYYFLLLYPYIKDKKNFRKITVISSVLVAIEVGFYFLLYIITFGYPFVERMTYMYHEAAKYIEIGNFATHVETYFLFLWLVAAVLRFTFYLYATSLIFGSIVKIKEFEPLLVPLSMITLLLSLAPENQVMNGFFLRDVQYAFVSFGLMGFSVLLWVGHKFKRRKKR